LIDLAWPHVAPGGCGLFLKGPGAASEIATVDPMVPCRIELLPTSSTRSNLVRVTRLR
jgi:hypothetical protein